MFIPNKKRLGSNPAPTESLIKPEATEYGAALVLDVCCESLCVMSQEFLVTSRFKVLSEQNSIFFSERTYYIVLSEKNNIIVGSEKNNAHKETSAKYTLQRPNQSFEVLEVCVRNLPLCRRAVVYLSDVCCESLCVTQGEEGEMNGEKGGK